MRGFSTLRKWDNVAAWKIYNNIFKSITDIKEGFEIIRKELNPLRKNGRFEKEPYEISINNSHWNSDFSGQVKQHTWHCLKRELAWICDWENYP